MFASRLAARTASRRVGQKRSFIDYLVNYPDTVRKLEFLVAIAKKHTVRIRWQPGGAILPIETERGQRCCSNTAWFTTL